MRQSDTKFAQTRILELLADEKKAAITHKRHMQLSIMRGGLSWLIEDNYLWMGLLARGKELNEWMIDNMGDGGIETVADLRRLAKKAGGFDKKLAPWKYIPDFGQGSLDEIRALVEKKR